MFDVDDIETIEGGNATEEAYFCALQSAINSSMWPLQGSYGRAMMDAIETGNCMLGRNAARDYYGNRIPSRTEVQEGTKGSRSFVAERMGEEWAAMMEGIE